ncbi:hypothetical protein Psal073_00783 [Piscirickettsia salmonis]|uniref:hypothetical protein n=1 Tax=Piscirickettsia salmonis TaxID=1238 RepID=UPI0012B9F87A|nr:hypothetical protein [Piscirickettsia salmonis]QGO65845.1 hypothetical protein Psal073_00783 [Piscirickettsia salmonis]
MHYVINKLKSQIEKQKATLLDDEESLSIESLLSSDKFQSIRCEPWSAKHGVSRPR